MGFKKLKILQLFDLSEAALYGEDYSSFLNESDWITEKHVFETLTEIGHDVKLFGLYDDATSLTHELQTNRPDLVFNMCEAFKNDRDLEPSVISLIELFGIPYTGCGPMALYICKDKSLSKKLASFHDVNVPKFKVSQKKRPIKSLKDFVYPAIVKPLDSEGSEGIHQLSYVENESDALERIELIHTKHKSDVIIEEYIKGREIYMGVLGNEQLNVFHPWEVTFQKLPETMPKFATFKSKWDDDFRKKWGIKHLAAKGIDTALETRISDACKLIYKLFDMKGYGRIDLRLTDDDKFYFIEANPNPGIAKDEDFIGAAKFSGLSYSDILSKIVALSGA